MRHAQPVNPRPAHQPPARGIVAIEAQVDVNLRSHCAGDGSQARVLPASPSVGKLAPMRTSPKRTMPKALPTSSPLDAQYEVHSQVATTVDGSTAEPAMVPPSPAILPPSPDSLNRAARALTGLYG